jgi:hypothetical protein
MTEINGVAAEPARGTAAHYMYFLDWAEKKGELATATVQNWRVASIKALEIEDHWQDVNVIDFDLEAHLQRFETLRRTSYTSGSMNAYKSRARTGIEAYRAWQSGASDWKPKSAGAPRRRTPKSKAPDWPNLSITGAAPSSTPRSDHGGYVPSSTPLIEHQLPLRPGIRAHITLPEDLTEKEAMRVARFVQSLAFSSDQPAITTGEASGLGRPALRGVQVGEAGDPSAEGVELAGVRDARPGGARAAQARHQTFMNFVPMSSPSEHLGSCTARKCEYRYGSRRHTAERIES